MGESEVKQAMINASKEVILVAHSEKLTRIFYHTFEKWDKINTFITDSGADSNLLKKVEEYGVKVIVAT